MYKAFVADLHEAHCTTCLRHYPISKIPFNSSKYIFNSICIIDRYLYIVDDDEIVIVTQRLRKNKFQHYFLPMSQTGSFTLAYFSPCDVLKQAFVSNNNTL